MNRRNIMTGLAGTALLGLVPSAALAQRAATAAAGIDEMKLPALMGGDFSTATSQLAVRRANNPAVREFARMEITEQAAVAKAFGARPGSAGMRPDQAAIVEQLSAAPGGPAFDMMYIEGQIAGHRELLDIHRRYARSGRDPMARGASTVGVTGIETHLFLLQNLRRQIA